MSETIHISHVDRLVERYEKAYSAEVTETLLHPYELPGVEVAQRYRCLSSGASDGHTHAGDDRAAQRHLN